MKYSVVVSPVAAKDRSEAYARVKSHAPYTAAKWLERFEAAMQRLDQNPARFPRAAENSKVPFDLREFQFGRRRSISRVLFTIDGDLVRILRIRRAQRRFMSRSEIDESLEEND